MKFSMTENDAFISLLHREDQLAEKVSEFKKSIKSRLVVDQVCFCFFSLGLFMNFEENVTFT